MVKLVEVWEKVTLNVIVKYYVIISKVKTSHEKISMTWRNQTYFRFGEETKVVFKEFLENVIRDAVKYIKLAKRTAMDVVCALKRQDRTLYGFGG